MAVSIEAERATTKLPLIGPAFEALGRVAMIMTIGGSGGGGVVFGMRTVALLEAPSKNPAGGRMASVTVWLGLESVTAVGATMMFADATPASSVTLPGRAA